MAKRLLYNPDADKPFKLSRSKIDLFIECPLCFYLDRRLGISRPPGFPFTLNSAVDHLLKKEFDIHRTAGTKHPLQKKYGIDARPVAHEELEDWRENFKGIQHHHEPTNFIITGAIDDLWINDQKEYIVVDYKATSKMGAIEALDKDWHSGYKRQMEVYQWLLAQKGYKVSSVGYFVYANGRKDRAAFDGKLEFDLTLIPYKGETAWIEPTLAKIKKTLDGDAPRPSPECEFCSYREAINLLSSD